MEPTNNTTTHPFKIVVKLAKENTHGLLANAKLVVTEGAYEGLEISGFSVWAGRDNPAEINVTPPSQKREGNRAFWFVRGQHKALFDDIRHTYRKMARPAAAPTPDAAKPRLVAVNGTATTTAPDPAAPPQ